MLIILMKRSDYIEIRQTKKMGRGIFAKRDIPPNVQLMSIQQERFITYSRVKDHSILSRLDEEVDCKITCFAYLLAHCAKNTQLSSEELEIKEYIKELPSYFHNLICWDDEQLLLLECEELLNKIRISKENFLSKYTHIQQCLTHLLSKSKSLAQDITTEAQSKRSNRQRTTHFISHKQTIDQQQISALLTISFEEVLKFIAVIKSRNIYWADEHDCHSEVGALIPYLELFNHSDNTQCKVELAHDCETVTTIRPIRKGQEIFVRYGENLTPELCLENYGMLPTPILASPEDKENECHEEDPTEEKQKGIRQERMELAARFKQLRSESKPPLLQVN